MVRLKLRESILNYNSNPANFNNAGSIPATSTMKQPDAKKHFYVSILKSTVRIVGYALIPFNITAAVSTLIISEAIGIIEETV